MKKKLRIIAFLLVTGLVSQTLSFAQSKTDFSDLVNPLIGTGGHGHTYPGASMPFGMVQLSPDTRLDGWDGCSAYHYSDDKIYGFSHTHLSGTGCSDYGDILLMPTVSEPVVKDYGFASKFKHEDEIAKPGYYSVLLENKTKVELTVTKRCGFHKYTFPEIENQYVVVDLKHRDQVIESSIQKVNDYEIVGMRRSKAWATDQYVYFVIRFNKPISDFGIYVDDILQSGKTDLNAKNIKAYYRFKKEKNNVLLAKVGISGVSIEGARKNLDAEIKDWDFDKIQNLAKAEWNKELGKIEIEGGSKDQQTVFYTSLYHAMLNPNLYCDVDGSYRGTDLKIHQSSGFENYSVFSLWDTYRATHPLFTIIEKKRTSDFINTFISQYKYGGLLPVWELSGNETNCMIGYHSVSVIADAYLKGIKGFDAEQAFQAMVKSAEQDKNGLEFYKTLGFIPANEESESVSKTLEYAYDDWCIAQMAKALGKNEEYKKFIQRAQYYKNVFDGSTGFLRARMNNSWFSPFEPAEVNFNYTEANAWQYGFAITQDISGFMELLGGKENLSKKLDQLFSAESKTTGRDQADITGLIGQYAQGNEPSHHMAYLYNYVGEPWKTQKIIKQILDEMYSNKPDGLCGNEDCGQMSAWYVMSAMGIYSVTPGSDIYAIGTPLFNKVTIHLENGKTFIIKANGISDKNFYIQSMKLNGIASGKSYIKHSQIENGGEIVFEMGTTPNKSWGSKAEDIPVSEITENLITPAPFIIEGKRVFDGSTTISMGNVEKYVATYYTTDGSQPNQNTQKYRQPFTINESVVIKAFSIKNGCEPSFGVSSVFTKISGIKSIKIKNPYSPQYSAGGDIALIDYIRGPKNFRTGSWQGYEGVDLEATIDLGQIQTIKKLSTGFLQDEGSWIFMPSSVEYAVSENGVDFKIIGSINNNFPKEESAVTIKDFSVNLTEVKARYIRVIAKNAGPCPTWHLGAGSKSWIFADEITIE
ncbi:MAG: glycoside hydrolase family 92 protein [Bacteroidetes bacterium]|nr:glycoside hydrolase family 92 protein [Bacteroidota bacterium]